MDYTDKNKVHVKEILNNIPKEKFQLVKIFHSGVNPSSTGRIFSHGVAVVKNNKLAGRLEDIKLLESLEPESRKRFQREGKILSAMNHKNIPRVYDILEFEDRLLFRYEHVEGYSLKEILDYLIKKKEDFPKYVATSIIYKLMCALYYAHNEVRYNGQKKSIVHCDIKPSNIILCADNYTRKVHIDEEFISLLRQNKVEPYLIDFGIATFRGKSTVDGTTPYLSYAQVSQHKLDWRTDIHQLMLVYHEILTMHTPYSKLSRNKIMEEKLQKDFNADKTTNMTNSIREFIEKGTRRDPIDSFSSEKSCIKEFSRIESRQKKLDYFKKNKKSLIIFASIILFIVLSFYLYRLWDYETQSTDAIIRDIGRHRDPTIEQLETAVSRIQIRAFENKYYDPLVKGEFRNMKNGKPLYPSYLDSRGNWVLAGPETESAGAFVGLLFNYSDRYPKLLVYAKEYAEPILESDFDGTYGKRYMYALIPGYEVTHDERYLKKLINISDTLMYQFGTQEGTTQSDDLYYGKLFLYVYNKTGQNSYLNFYNHYMKTFINNNIDQDGYIYEFSSVNATSIYGRVPDDKMGKLVTPLESSENLPIGSYLMLSSVNKSLFKSITSPFSKDFVEILTNLDLMYRITKNKVYDDAYQQASRYYVDRLPEDSTDYLFVSNLNEMNDIPKDAITTIKAVYLFKDKDKVVYKNKLSSLLTTEYLTNEAEKGVIIGNVLIDTFVYVQSDETKKNQTLIESDALFLEFNR